MPFLYNLPYTAETKNMKMAFQNQAGRGPFSNTYPKPPPIPISNVCFIADTELETDQGRVKIQDLDESYSVNGSFVLCLTKTKTDESFLIKFASGCLGDNLPSTDVITSQHHGLLYNGVMIEARFFLQCRGVTAIPYKQEILYNIVLEERQNVQISNLYWDTLPKECLVAKYFLNDASSYLWSASMSSLCV